MKAGGVKAALHSGYGPGLAFSPSAEATDWRIQWTPARREPENLAEEGIRTARSLFESAGRAVNVFYSGGIDSEFMVHCFMAAGVPFRVVTGVFENGLNAHDLQYVEDFQRRYPHLEYHTERLDVSAFLNSEAALDYARETQCSLPHLLPLFHLMDRIDGPLAIASGEPFLEPHQGRWCLKEREAIAGVCRHFQRRNREGTPFFFQSNAEIFLAYLQDPVWRELAAGRRPGKLHSLTSRIDVYARFFDIAARTKFHGYEKMQGLMDSLQLRIEQMLPGRQGVRYYSYDELVDELRMTLGAERPPDFVADGPLHPRALHAGDRAAVRRLMDAGSSAARGPLNQKLLAYLEDHSDSRALYGIFCEGRLNAVAAVYFMPELPWASLVYLKTDSGLPAGERMNTLCGLVDFSFWQMEKRGCVRVFMANEMKQRGPFHNAKLYPLVRRLPRLQRYSFISEGFVSAGTRPAFPYQWQLMGAELSAVDLGFVSATRKRP